MAAEILRECATWLRQHANVQQVCSSNGGWERWAQLDLGGHLKLQNHRVIHQDRCFTGNGEVVDFTVHELACIELKTFGYQYNVPELIQAYRSRMQTARQRFERLKLNPDNEDNEKFCVGIANVDDIVTGLRYVFNTNSITASNFMKPLKQCFGAEYEHAAVSNSSGARWIITFCKVD